MKNHRTLNSPRSKFPTCPRPVPEALLTAIGLLAFGTAGRAQELAGYLPMSELRGPKTHVPDGFGSAMAMDGDTLVVGAPQDPSPAEDDPACGPFWPPRNLPCLDHTAPVGGGAYVFVRKGNHWIEQAFLMASNTDTNDGAGSSVAISADTVVVGAPGESSQATGVDGDGSDNSLAGAGAAYVFVRNGETWTQQAYLKAPNPREGDSFGNAVAVSEDTLVVASALEDGDGIGADAGAVYVFGRNGTTWSQRDCLKPSNAGAGDRFGEAVAMDRTTVVVGAPHEASAATGVNGDGEDNSSEKSGAVYAFARGALGWDQQAYIKPLESEAGAQFGGSVSLSIDTLAAGASHADTDGVDAGEALVFERSATGWHQVARLVGSKLEAGNLFGTAIAVSGDTIVVGAPEATADSIPPNFAPGVVINLRSGAAYVFEREGTDWIERVDLTLANAGGGERIGSSVVASGELVAAGSPETSTFQLRGDLPFFLSETGAVSLFSLPAESLDPISTITRTAEGTRVTIPPAFGRQIGIGYSEDTTANSWVDLGSFSEADGSSVFVDPDPVHAARRSGFYRAFLRSAEP